MALGVNKDSFTTDFDVGSNKRPSRTRIRIISAVHNVRVSMTLLMLVVGIVILGLAANILSVYRATHLPADFFLPIWPENLDLRPINAHVAGGTIITLINAVSLFASKNSTLRNNFKIHSCISLLVPIVGFIASLVALSLYFAVNASSAVYSLHSWTCRWNMMPMTSRPYFGTLCKESRATLGLAVLVIPVEIFVFGVACLQALLERKSKGNTQHTSDFAPL